MHVVDHLHRAHPYDLRRLAKFLGVRTFGFTDSAVAVMVRYALGQR